MRAYRGCGRMSNGLGIRHDEEHEAKTRRPERVRKRGRDNDPKKNNAALGERNAYRVRKMRRDRRIEQERCAGPNRARREKMTARISRVGPDGEEGNCNRRKRDEQRSALPTLLLAVDVG
jgi:hypothetical protein